jgi:hypothetical protein
MSVTDSLHGQSSWCRGLALLSALFIGVAGGHCSLTNQEGPDATCALLECGRINACRDGIIAQCADGKTVEYRVCGTEDVCGEEWQVTGQYRCSSDATDCEGCRPERDGCDDPELGGGAATGGSSGSATGGSAGASATGGGGAGP